MHQPWASLLIKGIKIHEGRVWNSSHRGRLWIHSSSKEPDPEIVKMEMENHEVTEEIAWPVGALLGFVTVDEVLPQEEYREKYPNGLSTSPYVFVCEGRDSNYVIWSRIAYLFFTCENFVADFL